MPLAPYWWGMWDTSGMNAYGQHPANTPGYYLYVQPVSKVAPPVVLKPAERARLALAATRVPPRPVCGRPNAGPLRSRPVLRPRRTPVRGHVGWVRRGGRRPL